MTTPAPAHSHHHHHPHPSGSRAGSVRSFSVAASSRRSSFASSVGRRLSRASLAAGPGPAAATADASRLPDFAFLAYPTLPPRPEPLAVLDEASWSYSGPLLDLVPSPEQVEDELPRLLPESFYEFADSAFSSLSAQQQQQQPQAPAPAAPASAHDPDPARGYYSSSDSDNGNAHGPSAAAAAASAEPHVLLLRPPPHSAGEILSSSLIPFLLFVNAFLAANGVAHYWITVRTTRPTHEFDLPRWHTDDFFWDTFKNLRRPTPCDLHSHSRGRAHIHQGGAGPHRDLETDWKLCTALTGPPTLFIPLQYQSAARSLQRRARAACATHHVCTSVRCVGCTTAAEAVRDAMNADTEWMGIAHHRPPAVSRPPAHPHHHPHHQRNNTSGSYGRPLSRRHSRLSFVSDATSMASALSRLGDGGGADVAECAFFRIGEQCGAVHSEPRMNEDRVFVNVVPAKEDELKKLMARWGMQYPRDWWVGSRRTRPFPMSSGG